jgi:hypothetical protein
MQNPDPAEATRYNTLVESRYLILWLHGLIVLALTLVYLYDVPLTRTPLCLRLCGTWQILRASVLTAPFLISGIYTTTFVSASRIRLVAFGSILVLGAVIAGIAFSKATPAARMTDAMTISAIATCVYLISANALLRHDSDD